LTAGGHYRLITGQADRIGIQDGLLDQRFVHYARFPVFESLGLAVEANERRRSPVAFLQVAIVAPVLAKQSLA